MDANAPGEWQAYFTFAGLVAGGLTGLIFIAFSIQVSEVTARHAYVARARTTLVALTGFVVLCGLVILPGQSARTLGVEGLALFIFLVLDVARSLGSFQDRGRQPDLAILVRTTLAVGLLGVGAIGCLGLLADVPGAMAVVAVAILFSLPIRIIQAWALLVAAVPIQPEQGGGPGA